MKIKAGFLLVALVVLPLFGIGCKADTSIGDFPEGCTNDSYDFNGNNLVLNELSSKDSLYLFHNISDTDYWLNHPVTENPGASAGWASNLSAGKWSALAISGNQKSDTFEMTCSTMADNGKITYLDCEEVIKTCRINNPDFGKNNGSYWVAEDKPLDELLEIIKSRGIGWSN